MAIHPTPRRPKPSPSSAPLASLARNSVLSDSRRRRGRFESAEAFLNGDLITGQNQNAGPMVARLMMQRVLAKKSAAVV